MRRFVQTAVVLVSVVLGVAGCKGGFGTKRPAKKKPVATKPAESKQPEQKAPPPMVQPVPLWKDGKIEKQVDGATAALHGFMVMNLGEDWTPYVFTDGLKADGSPAKNTYRPTYLDLARGEFPDNYHGDRAREDKYLELYGIMPTLYLLRERFRTASTLECAKDLDLKPLITFDKLLTYDSKEQAARSAAEFHNLDARIKQLQKKYKVDSPEALDAAALKNNEREELKRYHIIAPNYHAIYAAQQRLKCEGYIAPKVRYLKGGYDWVTQDALAAFEKRHRVFGWGYLGLDTLKMLRLTPMEAEREAVLRVLTERAMHAAGVIEDGSTSYLQNKEPRTYTGSDGKPHQIRNLEAELREAIVTAFGLQTPELTLGWLESLAELPKGQPILAAINSPELPEYYDGDMVFTLEYDRGDVWFDFPWDDQGKEIFHPVSRRPKITLYTLYNSQRIPLARYGTTIGGWKGEKVGDVVMWKYKESPTGPRVWQRIVAAPVWLPPDSTPPRELLKRPRKPKPEDPPFVVKYDELGPSYASAYGLVAAYHEKYWKAPDGTIKVGGMDEGIRTHGSVDYMSIMRRHSHGCHRLHNHIALRLMSFVLSHRPHHRLGQEGLGYERMITYENVEYQIKLQQGGYVFALDTPIEINVFEGTIKGKVKAPIEIAIPKFDPDAGVYLHPDAGAVLVRDGVLIPTTMPTQQPVYPTFPIIEP
jgi:hypothetical protein